MTVRIPRTLRPPPRAKTQVTPPLTPARCPLSKPTVASEGFPGTIRPRSLMKSVAIVLAFLLSANTLFAQATGSGARPAPVAPPAPAPAQPGVESQPAASTPSDSTVIKASTASKLPAEEDSAPVPLQTLIQSGGWAMVVMGAMSVLTFMLVLVNLFTLRRGAILSPHYMNTADVLLKKKDYLGLLAISSRHSEAVARVAQRTLDFATKNPSASFDVIKEIAESEGSAQAAALQHRPTYLADVGMLSPMVGLLFTVWGIIRSFGVLGSGQLSQSRDVLLATGVAEALVATGAGLVLGIVAFMFYALFRNKVQSLISDLEVATAHIVGMIAINYSKRREPSRAAIEEEF
jgi:biopolymer transport protein ExbB